MTVTVRVGGDQAVRSLVTLRDCWLAELLLRANSKFLQQRMNPKPNATAFAFSSRPRHDLLLLLVVILVLQRSMEELLLLVVV